MQQGDIDHLIKNEKPLFAVYEVEDRTALLVAWESKRIVEIKAGSMVAFKTLEHDVMRAVLGSFSELHKAQTGPIGVVKSD